jgi:hypothetical protein
VCKPSRDLANHRTPEYIVPLPALTSHAVLDPARPARLERHLPPEVRLVVHQLRVFLSPPRPRTAAIDSVKKPPTHACLRFSRKELQIGVARYASTKPHACMHAYCTVQVQVRYSHCLISSQSVHLSISPDQVVVPAATVHHEHSDTSEVHSTNIYGCEYMCVERA